MQQSEWLKDILNKIEKPGPAKVEPGQSIELPKEIKKRSIIRSVDGKPAWKRMGPVTGNCSNCKRKATKRFQGILFCNPCYRRDLERRWAENYDRKKEA